MEIIGKEVPVVLRVSILFCKKFCLNGLKTGLTIKVPVRSNFKISFFALTKGNDVFSNLSKPFFNPITREKVFFSAVLFAFARPLLNLHVPEVPKDNKGK